MFLSSPLIYSFGFFLLGTVLGSFANVCIHRLPLSKSIVTPGSQCPYCQSSIRAWENIPIFSFLLLRGTCSQCHQRISFKYPAVEFFSGISVLALFLKFQLTPDFFIFTTIFISLIIITMIDLEHQMIPDVITLPGIIIGLLCGYFLRHDLMTSFIGGVVGGGLFFLVAILSRGGMGGGDIKLIAMLGTFLGWLNILLVILLSSFLGAVIGIILIGINKKKRKDPIPFGPFIALGTYIVVFWGREIFYWYQRLLS